MGRVDPMDLLLAPPWVPRLTRIGGRKVLDGIPRHRRETMDEPAAADALGSGRRRRTIS